MSNQKGMTPVGAYKPPTAEKKLEKQVVALRKNQFTLSTTPNPYEVRKDDRIGDHMVIITGMAGYGVVNHMILHRLIGTDHGIDKEKAWVMSKASDIPGFLQNQDYSGEKKAYSRISEIRQQFAIQAGVLKLDSFKNELYPDGTNRKEALDIAHRASAQHAKVKGGNQFSSWLLYLDSATVAKELKIQSIYTLNSEYTMAISDPILDIVGYRTTLDDGTPQKEVPYLYGKDAKEVGKIFYQTMLGNFPEVPAGERKWMTGAAPQMMYSNYVPGNIDVMRVNLIKELHAHEAALKAVNVARTEYRANKIPANKNALKGELDEKEEELYEIQLKIHSIEQMGTRPSIHALKVLTGAISSGIEVKQVRAERKILYDTMAEIQKQKAAMAGVALPQRGATPRLAATKLPGA